MGEKVLLKTFKNGNKLWGTRTRCIKCGGTGKVIWSYANHVCFDCNGKGWYWYEEREYTPENLAKREAAKAKKRAQQEAEQAEREAEQARREAEREAARQAWIAQNRGQYVGEIGERLTATVTLTRRFQYEVPCFNAPWAKDLVTGYVFKTDDGNTLVWKTTGTLCVKVYVTENDHPTARDRKGWYDWKHFDDGARLTITGTVKAHEEYSSVCQTILSRVKVIEKEVKQ